MQPLIRRMLEERFKLVLKRESKEMQVFKLSVAASGSKLARSSVSENDCGKASGAPTECHQLLANQARGLNGTAVDMADLIAKLELWSDKPIVDETGLEGLFSIRSGPFSRLTPLRLPLWVEDLPEGQRPPPEPQRPSVFKVLEQELGLRLESGKAVVEIFQIESIQRPSAN
jgi:uncharacterized protein (TIGR03435 family)